MFCHNLAEIHSKFGIYSESQINGNVDYNIVSDFKIVPELCYLADFYQDYFKQYKDAAEDKWLHQSFLGDSIARSTDLPFIGSKVIEQNKADYFFVFKGSLQRDDRLSMTVLSCFWLFQDVKPFQSFFDRYWPNTQNYHPLVNNLGINRDIAERSYITDFARVANANGNRDAKVSKRILEEEISLLDPKLVILIGSEPRNAFLKEMTSHPERYMTVPFSLHGVPKKTQIEGPGLYEKVRKQLQKKIF
jgi:hypothetical protein